MWYSKNLPLSDSRIIVDRVQPAWYDFLDGSVLTRSLARAHQSERSGRRVPIRQVSAAIGQRVMSLGALCPRAEPSDGVSIELFFYDEHSFTLVCVCMWVHTYTQCVCSVGATFLHHLLLVLCIYTSSTCALIMQLLLQQRWNGIRSHFIFHIFKRNNIYTAHVLRLAAPLLFAIVQDQKLLCSTSVIVIIVEYLCCV